MGDLESVSLKHLKTLLVFLNFVAMCCFAVLSARIHKATILRVLLTALQPHLRNFIYRRKEPLHVAPVQFERLCQWQCCCKKDAVSPIIV